MAGNGNRVTICSQNEAWARALRLLLPDFDVELSEDPSAAVVGSDVLVWSSSESLQPVTVESIAAQVPTLLVADSSLVIRAVDAGCRGFLSLSSPLEDVRDGVEVIANGGAVLPPDLLGTLLRHLVDRRRTELVADELDGLTNREQEVFRLSASGSRKEQIAAELFISPATARTHLQHVYRKLGVHSQAELIALAVRLGVYGPDEEKP